MVALDRLARSAQSSETDWVMDPLKGTGGSTQAVARFARWLWVLLLVGRRTGRVGYKRTSRWRDH